MHQDQAPYRELYDAIMDYDGDALHDDVVRPWMRRQDAERRWLDALRRRPGSPIPPVSPEENWRLYALSRIVELLTLSFAPREDGRPDTWETATVQPHEHVEVMAHFGLEPVAREGFHPFFHEVVSVDADPDPAAAPRVVHTYWPGYRLGALLVCRAGCRVRAGREHLVKEIAERSTLYWAFARQTRPTHDPSVGWGSNSQWRTNFRRDYEIGGTLYLNVDGKGKQPGGMDDDVTGTERLELLRHRCFVRCPKPHDDLWPYDFTSSEPA